LPRIFSRCNFDLFEKSSGVGASLFPAKAQIFTAPSLKPVLPGRQAQGAIGG
jgi:hypothetical protein